MKRLIILALAITIPAAALAQTWKGSYQAGLDAIHDGQWADARQDFQEASKDKPGDVAKGTLESSSLFKQSYWRDGAPYSPVFLSAYSGLKEAVLLPSSSRTYLLQRVAKEFESLITSGEYCVETFFFLDETYVLLSENEKREALGQQFSDVSGSLTWKVDTAGIEDKDRALIAQLPIPGKSQPKSDLPAKTAQTGPAASQAVFKSPADVQPAQDHKAVPVPQKEAPVPQTKQADDAAGALAGEPEQPLVLVSSVQGSAAGPTAPAPDALPAPTTEDPGPVLAIEPAISAPKGKNRKPTKQTPDEQPASSIAPDPAPTAPTPTPAKRGRGRHQKPDDSSTNTEVAFTGVAPVEVGKIEHPVTPKVDPKLAVGVPAMPTKFALIIGNSESKMENGQMPFASDDAMAVRKALTENAGYADDNIEVVANATAAQMAATVNALASRLDDKSTVFMYFSGVGENVDGKDFLAGVDSDIANDASTMISKDDVYKAFMLKGARIFAFYQCNRPIVDGHFFGSEVPMVGSIAQMQATLPGQSVYGVNTNGKLEGLFTVSFIDTLSQIRSNQTPILDFGWQVFYSMRRGGTGQEGGSSNQSPTLPVPTNMASDARFLTPRKP